MTQCSYITFQWFTIGFSVNAQRMLKYMDTSAWRFFVIIFISCLSLLRSGRFCLWYDPLKWEFIAFTMDIILIKKHIADTDVVFAQKCYYTSSHMFLWHDVIQ